MQFFILLLDQKPEIKAGHQSGVALFGFKRRVTVQFSHLESQTSTS